MLVALVLAGLAAWAVWNFLQSVEDEALEGQQLVTVFRAGEFGIDEGTEGDILVSDFNANGDLIVESEDQIEDVPADAIQTEQELREVLAGQLAAGPISGNAIITRSQWAEVTLDVRPLSEEIEAGKQALTISTDNVQGVNGFVEAGDKINMIISLDIEFDLIPVDFEGITLPADGGGSVEETGGGPGTGSADPEAESVVVAYTRYVMQGIEVLAVGRDIRPDEDAPPTVEVEEEPLLIDGEEPAPTEEELGNATVFTLEVTPEQAERIVYAFENGNIWLTLVPEDFVEVETNGVVVNNLFGGDLIEEIFESEGS